MNLKKINDLFNATTTNHLETQELGIQFSKFIKYSIIIFYYQLTRGVEFNA